MKYNTCPKCKTKISADLAECPECGSHFSDSMQEHSTPREKSRVAMLPTVIAGVLIFIAFAGGLLFNASRHPTSETPSPTPEIIEIVASTPSPTPTVTSIRLYTFGRELDADGFTAYVGDKAFTISIILEPEIRNPAVSWSITDMKLKLQQFGLLMRRTDSFEKTLMLGKIEGRRRNEIGRAHV